MALLDLLQAQVGRVVERRLSLRIYQRELTHQRVPIAELSQQIGALIEADQEEIVVGGAGFDEGIERVTGAAELALHAAGDIEDDADADGRVFVIEEENILLDLVLENLKVLLVKTRHQTIVKIRDRDGARNDLSWQLEDRLALFDFAFFL